jgi:hypothetical protein
MNPATIALIIGLVEEAIKLEPAIAAELQSLFNKPQPTPEDWLALRERIMTQSFESLAPDAKTV